MEDIDKMSVDLKKEVGSRVRSARKSVGFTGADTAAAALGVSPTALYEIEQGKTWLSAEMAARIQTFWKVPLASLFAMEAIKPSPAEALEVLREVVEGRGERTELESLRAENEKLRARLAAIEKADRLLQESDDLLQNKAKK